MSWKLIFNTSFRRWGFITYAMFAAKESGYQFFNWNGWIYSVDGKKTDILEEDCY